MMLERLWSHRAQPAPVADWRITRLVPEPKTISRLIERGPRFVAGSTMAGRWEEKTASQPSTHPPPVGDGGQKRISGQLVSREDDLGAPSLRLERCRAGGGRAPKCHPPRRRHALCRQDQQRQGRSRTSHCCRGGESCSGSATTMMNCTRRGSSEASVFGASMCAHRLGDVSVEGMMPGRRGKSAQDRRQRGKQREFLSAAHATAQVLFEIGPLLGIEAGGDVGADQRPETVGFCHERYPISSRARRRAFSASWTRDLTVPGGTPIDSAIRATGSSSQIAWSST